MQCKTPRKLLKRRAVKPVAGYGTAKRLHMHPDLMCASGLKPQTDERTPVRCTLQHGNVLLRAFRQGIYSA